MHFNVLQCALTAFTYFRINMRGNTIKLKHNLLSDMLDEAQLCQNLQIFCKDGTFHCNEFFFATIFPAFRPVLETLHNQEDSLSLSIPDICVRDLEVFFSNIYAKKLKIKTTSYLHHLLYWSNIKVDQTHGNSVKYEVDENIDEFEDNFNYDFIAPSFEDCQDSKTVSIPIKKSGKVKKVSKEEEDEDWMEEKSENGKKSSLKRKYQFKKSNKMLGYQTFPYKALYCEVCNIKFEKRGGLYLHVYNKHGPHMEQKCEECGLVFPNPSMLVSHKDRKHGEQNPCHLCGQLLTKSQVKGHMRNRHTKEEHLQCEVCSKTFTNIHRLNGHIKRIHSEVSPGKAKKTKGQWGAECDKLCNCGISFPTLDEKVKHFKIVHKGYEECPHCHRVVLHAASERHVCDPFFKENKNKSGKHKVHVCNDCGKQFTEQSAFYYHKYTVHEAEEVNCEVCGKMFRSKVHLQDHISRVHKEKTSCTICGIAVRNINNHIKAVHTENDKKKYQCEFCWKGFRDKRSIDVHKQSVHLNLRPYNCRYECGVAYNDPSNRRQHEKKVHGALFTQK